MAKVKMVNATVSTFKIDDQFERTLRAELDGANEIIWLTKISIDGFDRMTEYLPSGYYVSRRNWVLTLFAPKLDPAGVPVVDGMEV